MKRLATALIISLLTQLPLAATSHAEEGINPMIPGGNAAPAGHAPKAIVETPLYDFGTALEGKMVSHVFKIKNVGEGYLDIRGIKTSCGCTTGNPSKTHVAPGDDSEISVAFDTRFQKGHQVRTIMAFTNDPNSPQVTMTMQGVVKKQVEASPSEVSFGTVRKGSEGTKEIVISDLVGGGPFTVGPISNSNSAIKVTQEKRPDGKPGAILKVALTNTMPIGAFDDTIKVTTNRVPLNVDVFGTVTGDLTVDPVQVSFGLVGRGKDIVRLVKLSNQGAHPIKVLEVKSSSPSVVASAEPVVPGKEYRLTVMLRRGTPDGQLPGKLTITTDDPNQSTIILPFYAIIGPYQG
jgi:hypothetical protein